MTGPVFHPAVEPLESFRGRKVTVMGLGLFGGGRGVADFLCQQGAEVIVTDLRPADVLAPVVDTLRHLRIEWVLGQHREKDFLGADLVVPSPAVPRDAPLLALCRQRRIALDTEMNLFFKYCRGKICAVTGTNGKTTTTSLIGDIVRAFAPGTRVGGNIGKSLLPEVTSITPEDWVILELSSFQLEDLASLERRPEVSVVTNLSPNHLDRHGTYADYVDAKRTIVERGREPNVAILNAEDAGVRAWRGPARRTLLYGHTGRILPRAPGVWVNNDTSEVVFQIERSPVRLFRTDDLALPGRFNLLNAAAAAAAGVAVGVPASTIRSAVRSFSTVEHRLERFHEADGVEYFNDSIATTPESTIAALEALGPRIVLVCGGAPGGRRSYRALGQAIARRTRCVILIGETAVDIAAAIPSFHGGPLIQRAGDFEEAVVSARRHARSGDHVLLSPACSSYDMFVNFEARGRSFKSLVRSIAAAAGPSTS